MLTGAELQTSEQLSRAYQKRPQENKRNFKYNKQRNLQRGKLEFSAKKTRINA
jgi:hypothetical protein